MRGHQKNSKKILDRRAANVSTPTLHLINNGAYSNRLYFKKINTTPGEDLYRVFGGKLFSKDVQITSLAESVQIYGVNIKD